MKHSGFYTMKGYERHSPSGIAAAMEDYLEMLSRMMEETDSVRGHELAEN